jgi:hypothetical protein
MNMRGFWAEAPDNCKKINVTSAQSKSSPYRLQLSPMHIFSEPYAKDYMCFENYWQSGKRYETLENQEQIEKQSEWWKAQTSGKRRYPLGKGKKILHGIYPELGFKEPLDYISSRKNVYLPLYIKAVADSSVIKDLQITLKQKSIVIYDFDGPRSEDGKPVCLELTKELFYEKLNDPKFPFGHGYIVAGLISGVI